MEHCIEKISWTDVNLATNCTVCKENYHLKDNVCKRLFFSILLKLSNFELKYFNRMLCWM